VEVFGGAGWVLFGKERSQVEIFNDIDSDVVNFFNVIKDQPEAFIKSFDLELVSREKFENLRNTPTDSLTEMEKAHRFYYLIMAAWGGELGSPRFQTSVSDRGHGNRLIGALKNLRERIEPVHKRLQTVIIENLSWQECLERYDREYDSQKVVMYLDPPYPNNNINYQHNMRQIKAHEELASRIGELRSRFLLTSYNLPEIKDLYNSEGLYVQEVNFAAGMPTNGTDRSRNEEIIISNFDPNEL
jgi:DNA adenine methylase